MQNTISLTELATQQATKVSAITTSLIEARNEIDQLKKKLEEGQTEQNKILSGNKAEIDGLKSDLSASLVKIEDLEEGQNELTETLSETTTEIDGLKSDRSASLVKIEDLEEGQSELTAQIGEVSWPEGSYCILASGACPAGFTRYSGHIRAFDTYNYTPTYITPVVFGDSYMGCHGPCGQYTSHDAEFGITSCCK